MCEEDGVCERVWGRELARACVCDKCFPKDVLIKHTGGGADYAEGGGANTLSVTCPRVAKYVAGGGGEGGKYAVTPPLKSDVLIF